MVFVIARMGSSVMLLPTAMPNILVSFPFMVLACAIAGFTAAVLPSGWAFPPLPAGLTVLGLPSVITIIRSGFHDPE